VATSLTSITTDKVDETLLAKSLESTFDVFSMMIRNDGYSDKVAKLLTEIELFDKFVDAEIRPTSSKQLESVLPYKHQYEALSKELENKKKKYDVEKQVNEELVNQLKAEQLDLIQQVKSEISDVDESLVALNKDYTSALDDIRHTNALVLGNISVVITEKITAMRQALSAQYDASAEASTKLINDMGEMLDGLLNLCRSYQGIDTNALYSIASKISTVGLTMEKSIPDSQQVSELLHDISNMTNALEVHANGTLAHLSEIRTRISGMCNYLLELEDSLATANQKLTELNNGVESYNNYNGEV
jgi:hypothetical protein